MEVVEGGEGNVYPLPQHPFTLTTTRHLEEVVSLKLLEDASFQLHKVV